MNAARNRQAIIFIRANRGAIGSDEMFEQNVAWQRALCNRRAEEMGLTPIQEYIDHSGAIAMDKRPQLRDMLDELCALRDAAYVITKDTARLARNLRLLYDIKLALETAGAELVCATDTLSPHLKAQLASKH